MNEIVYFDNHLEEIDGELIRKFYGVELLNETTYRVNQYSDDWLSIIQKDLYEGTLEDAIEFITNKINE